MITDRLYIVMPAYNEEANIETVIKQWHPIVEKLNNGSRLIIANDGSSDTTYSKMVELNETYPLLMPIDKPNSGHGATLLFLYRKSIDDGVEYIFQTDSDGQTDPEQFWEFWNNRDCYDFQIGDRVGRQDGFSRVVVAKVLQLVVWVMLGQYEIDANTPFRLMRTERLKPILEVMPKDFFLCNIVISAAAVKRKERCKWYKITFKPRQGGVNSINMKRIFAIGVKTLRDFARIKKNL